MGSIFLRVAKIYFSAFCLSLSFSISTFCCHQSRKSSNKTIRLPVFKIVPRRNIVV